MSRLEDLLWAREDIRTRIVDCRDNRTAAALHQRFVDVVAQIDEAGGYGKPKAEETALDEFTTRLHERQSTTKAPRRAQGV